MRPTTIVLAASFTCTLVHAAAGLAQPVDPHAELTDAASARDCTDCHDALLSSHASSHPVNVDYVAAARASAGALKPVTALPTAVRLASGGMLVCTTCHDLRAASPGLLTLPMAGSALCTACHDR